MDRIAGVLSARATKYAQVAPITTTAAKASHFHREEVRRTDGLLRAKSARTSAAEGYRSLASLANNRRTIAAIFAGTSFARSGGSQSTAEKVSAVEGLRNG